VKTSLEEMDKTAVANRDAAKDQTDAQQPQVTPKP